MLLARTFLTKQFLMGLVTLFFLAVGLWAEPPAMAAEADDMPMRSDTNVRIPMRDDIALAARVYRPQGTGPFPALYATSPSPDFNDGAGVHFDLIQWYVRQGYAVVLVNTRGTGRSEGDYSFLSRTEQQDHYEVIEWIASQDWSNRRVGGFGSGYAATAQWQMAIQTPPSLGCIAPYMGVLDPYRDWAFPGGAASETFIKDWYEDQVRSPNAYQDPARLVTLDLRYRMLEHPLFDAYWAERNSADRIEDIQVPVYLMRTWDSSAPGAASSLAASRALRSVNRTLLLRDDAEHFARPEFHASELLPFYDWCLKREDSAFIERPEVRYQVPGRTLEKRDSQWPPGGTDFIPVYLDVAASALSFTTPDDEGRARYAQASDDKHLELRSGWLDQNLEISGPVMLELYAASSARDTAFEVSLYEQTRVPDLNAGTGNLPDFLRPRDSAPAATVPGKLRLISQGQLKASTRATDPDRSTRYQPWYPLDRTEPLNPGRVYQFDVALSPVAHLFREGSQVVLRIRQIEDASLQRLNPEDQVVFSEEHPSRLWLPATVGSRVSTARPAAVSTPQSPVMPGFLPGDENGDSNNGEVDYEEALFNSDSPVILLPKGSE